jgi:hypothetical protein
VREARVGTRLAFRGGMPRAIRRPGLKAALWRALALGALVVSAPAAATAQESTDLAQVRLEPLQLVEQLSVLVEDLTEDAATVALTRDGIQAAAESRLTEAGLELTTDSPASATLYFQISVLCKGPAGVCAIDVSSAVLQDVYMTPGATSAVKAKTWYTGQIFLATRALVQQQVHAIVRQQTDAFAQDVRAARQRRPATTAPARETGPVLGL